MFSVTNRRRAISRYGGPFRAVSQCVFLSPTPSSPFSLFPPYSELRLSLYLHGCIKSAKTWRRFGFGSRKESQPFRGIIRALHQRGWRLRAPLPVFVKRDLKVGPTLLEEDHRAYAFFSRALTSLPMRLQKGVTVAVLYTTDYLDESEVAHKLVHSSSHLLLHLFLALPAF